MQHLEPALEHAWYSWNAFGLPENPSKPLCTYSGRSEVPKAFVTPVDGHSTRQAFVQYLGEIRGPGMPSNKYLLTSDDSQGVVKIDITK